MIKKYIFVLFTLLILSSCGKSKEEIELEKAKIELEKTKDILASLGAIKKHQFLVGFALETNNELDNAKGKLEAKNKGAIDMFFVGYPNN